MGYVPLRNEYASTCANMIYRESFLRRIGLVLDINQRIQQRRLRYFGHLSADTQSQQLKATYMDNETEDEPRKDA